MSDKYILNGKIPVEEPDLMKWAEWFEKADRTVKKTQINNIEISTVFLGLDHGFYSYFKGQKQKPILFETMIFGGELDSEQERYSTWKEAEKGHDEMVEKVKKTL